MKHTPWSDHRRGYSCTPYVLLLQTQTDNEPERQQGLLMLNEWSVNLLQLNVVVLVLRPTLPLNVPVISEAHTANLIIQRHSRTLYMITNSLLLILQLCSLQWHKAMIKRKMLALCVHLCVCVCLSVFRYLRGTFKADHINCSSTVHLFLR